VSKCLSGVLDLVVTHDLDWTSVIAGVTQLCHDGHHDSKGT
jgi:hypothetical protein